MEIAITKAKFDSIMLELLGNLKAEKNLLDELNRVMKTLTEIKNIKINEKMI